jgi:hypothetical protein
VTEVSRVARDRERSARTTELGERLERLLAAAHQLAGTIAETERIAARSAWVTTEGRRPPGDVPRIDRLVPLAEVAARTGRHPDLLRRWCLEGRLAGVRIGRTWCLPERMIPELARFQRRTHPHRRPGAGHHVGARRQSRISTTDGAG